MYRWNAAAFYIIYDLQIVAYKVAYICQANV